MLFEFKAYRATGDLETGVLEGASPSDVHEQLRQRGLTPVSVGAEAQERKNWLTRDISLGVKQLSAAEISRISKTMSALLSSGTDLPEALGFVAGTVPRSHQRAFVRLQEGVSSGLSPAAAFRRERSTFPDDFVQLIAIGDQSNRLSDTLARASGTFAKRAATSAQMRTAFVYPAILVAAACILFAILTLVLVPAIKPVFESADLTPNMALQVLFSAHELAASSPGGLAAALVVGLGGIVIASATGIMQTLWCALAIRLPYFRELFRARAFATMARSLSLLIGAGASLEEAFKKTGRNSSGLSQSLLELAVEAVERGSPVAPVFAQANVPNAIHQFVMLAERSNKWPELMDTAADLLDAEADRTQARLMQLLTPAITIVIGLAMGFVMVSIVTALLGLNDALIP